MGPPKSTPVSAYANLPGISEADQRKLAKAGGKADDIYNGRQSMDVGNISEDTWRQMNKNKPPTDAASGAAPDLTDELVRKARQWSLLNQQAKRGLNSTFQTGPLGLTKKPGGI